MFRLEYVMDIFNIDKYQDAIFHFKHYPEYDENCNYCFDIRYWGKISIKVFKLVKIDENINPPFGWVS